VKRIALLFAALLVVPLLQAAPRGFTARDLVMLERLSAPTLSPDGSTIAFVQRQTDFDANRGRTSVHLLPVSGGSPRALAAGDGNDSSPQWSVDGRGVFVLSTRSGSSQVWRLDAAGGKPVQVTDYPLDVGSFRVSPDGSALAFSLEVFADCADIACTRQRLDARAAEKRSGVLHERLFVRHWDSWNAGLLQQLFVARLDDRGIAKGEPLRVSRGVDGDVPSRPFGDQGDYAWSPDGKALVFSARLANREEPWSTDFDLYLVAADGSGTPRKLTADNPATDTGPAFSADGRTLYYRAMRRAGFEADRYALMAMTLADGSRREIAPDWDRSADSIVLSADGRRIYTTAYDLGQHPLFAIDIASGRAQRIVGDGAIGGFDLRGETLVFARETLASPAQIFVAGTDGSDPRQLTEANAERLAGVRMGEYQQFSFDGWNGETVHGYVVKPWNFEAGRDYPVAFIIHGGPQGSMGNSFHYRWNPQTYAGQGWAVVFIDFHGSAGYGQAFLDSISGDWGGKPLVDLQKGWAHALASFDFLDGERACALGASYGGYMVHWIAGRWNAPWDCLVSHSGVFDMRMMAYATEELWFTEWENRGTAWEAVERIEQFNPVNHVTDWRVPMLVIHPQLDFRIPVEQGIAAFTALQRRGIDSQFLTYPDENHWVLKPQNSLQWHEVVNAWLHRHLDE